MCDRAICINCKLTEHENHKTQDLVQAATKAKGQLRTDLARVNHHKHIIETHSNNVTEELVLLEDKKTELTADITRRYTVLVAIADKLRDETLASLNTVNGKMESRLEKELETTQQSLEELTKLQQRVQQAVDSGAGC
ncbi:hypothetical protein BaRGS_00027196 [Batillaria attramentaria]|uniref:B box-type domain-containing protein n=1 Tax=Batillaria attramentaria TaxID=370345 RepID=A0ABD0K412_9CAEN